MAPPVGRERAGLFVTFEGVEGCGKSTQARRLLEHLRARGVPATLSREPGGTPLGERFREILLDAAQSEMEPATELFLYLASRAEHVAKVVVPALLSGGVVISDRFGDASVAYQGGGRGLGPATVEKLNQVATSGVKPDVTFLMDLDPEEGMIRLLRGRGEGARDRIESEVLGFHRKVRETYLRIAEREPARFEVIDASLPEEVIASAIADKIDGMLAGFDREAGRQP
jgi:dTMP kinase